MTTATAFRTRGIALVLTLILALGGAAVIGGCGDYPGNGSQDIEAPVNGDTTGDGITDFGGGNNYQPAPVPDLN